MRSAPDVALLSVFELPWPAPELSPDARGGQADSGTHPYLYAVPPIPGCDRRTILMLVRRYQLRYVSDGCCRSWPELSFGRSHLLDLARRPLGDPDHDEADPD